MDIIGHYSVPITRRAGFTESSIPPEYRDRAHMTEQAHVRCGLFAGDNLVQVTWSGTDSATLRNMQPNSTNVTIVGTIPAGGGYSEPYIPRAGNIGPGLRVGRIQQHCVRGGNRPGCRHRHRAGSHQHLKAVA